jgi:farnesyl-diphosphate farnesyltransferase
MGASEMLKLLLLHPFEFRTLAQYWLYHEPTRDISNPTEWKTSGYDRETMKKCWGFLDLTSRSFSAVIKELEGDLARVVSTFF